MGYPVWQTPAGTLGKIAAQRYYDLALSAIDLTDGDTVTYSLVAGLLPRGLQIQPNGRVSGNPEKIYTLEGVPFSTNVDITSEFTIRATASDGSITDRTFNLTITGNFPPEIVTVEDPLGVYLDGTEVSLQLEAIDLNGDTLTWSLQSGTLPIGLSLSNNGLISGILLPQVSQFNQDVTGWSEAKWNKDPWEFSLRSSSKVYNFTVAVTDGKATAIKKYRINVYAYDDVKADNFVITADNDRITSDINANRPPILLTKDFGSYTTVNSGEYFAFKFDGVDYDGYPVQYNINTSSSYGWDSNLNWDMGEWDRDSLLLPPGLSLDPNTGWMTGYIPKQAATSISYTFGIYLSSTVGDYVTTTPRLFTLTILGNLDLAVNWLTDTNLGSINTGAISNLSVAAVAASGQELTYSLDINSKLPQGLKLLSDGTISGRVSFQIMGFDQGKTTFDKALASKFVYQSNTNFDNNYTFSITASNVSITTVTLPTEVLTAGAWQPNTSYTVGQYITYNSNVYNIIRNFVSGSSFDTANLSLYWGYKTSQINEISATQTFTVRVKSTTYEPYENLYIKCLPSSENRQKITQIIENTDIFDPMDIYRPNDPNFGLQDDIKFLVSYGLKTSRLSDYIAAMKIRHFPKKFYFGDYKIAQGKDTNGNVLYDVLYVDLIEDTKIYKEINGVIKKSIPSAFTNINNKIPNWKNPKAATLAKNQLFASSNTTIDKGFINVNDSYWLNDPLNSIAPNDLTLMQVDIANNLTSTNLDSLPEWMISVQENNKILGYTSGAVLAYLKPGTGIKALFRMNKYAPYDIKVVPFIADRYILDDNYSNNFNIDNRRFVSQKYTSFDVRTKVSINIVPVATVDFAVDRPFSTINNQSLDYLIGSGGLDGIPYNLDKKTIIFATQEAFIGWGALIDDGWYQTTSVNNVLIPGWLEKTSNLSLVNQRSGVWQINVDSLNYVTLTFVQEINPGDYVYVNSGVSHANSYQLYDISFLSQGYTTPGYSQTFNAVLKPRAKTTFDMANTQFLNNVDTYTMPLVGDKYLKFPKIGVFTNGQ